MGRTVEGRSVDGIIDGVIDGILDGIDLGWNLGCPHCGQYDGTQPEYCSVINTLLKENALPVGVLPATSIVTEIRYGEEPAATIVCSTGGLLERAALNAAQQRILPLLGLLLAQRQVGRHGCPFLMVSIPRVAGPGSLFHAGCTHKLPNTLLAKEHLVWRIRNLLKNNHRSFDSVWPKSRPNSAQGYSSFVRRTSDSEY